MCGDTNSVMYTMGSNVSSNSLVHSHVNYLKNSHVDTRSIDIMEFISGNKGAIPFSDVHSIPTCGVVVKMSNNIMSHTCFTGLSVEQQEIDSTVLSNHRSFVFPSFMNTSKKHYVAMKSDGTLHTKGMNYIRKSGSVLSSTTTKEFVRIALRHETLMPQDCFYQEFVMSTSGKSHQVDVILF